MKKKIVKVKTCFWNVRRQDCLNYKHFIKFSFYQKFSLNIDPNGHFYCFVAHEFFKLFGRKILFLIYCAGRHFIFSYCADKHLFFSYCAGKHLFFIYCAGRHLIFSYCAGRYFFFSYCAGKYFFF